MRRFPWLLLLLALLLPSGARAQYTPDTLGAGYERRTFRMADDYEGEVVCTLVRKRAADSTRQAILYLHGYNDYFFQRALGDTANARGFHFYALDLRKYGRSIRPHQDPFNCRSLREYFADLDTALATVRAEGNERVWLMAHSTGGLIVSYWLAEKGGRRPVEGIVLNSPFLDWNFGGLMERVALPVVAWLGSHFPDWEVQGAGSEISGYAQSLLRAFHGEWDYDTRWKMSLGHPKKAGWIGAIEEAQQRVQQGIATDIPILVLSSDRSSPERPVWDDSYLRSDIVLDVGDIQRYGAKLGKRVTRDTVAGGIHDLILSPRPARDRAYRVIFDWLKHQ